MIPDHADFSDMLVHWARERPAGLALAFAGTRRTWGIRSGWTRCPPSACSAFPAVCAPRA